LKKLVVFDLDGTLAESKAKVPLLTGNPLGVALQKIATPAQ